MKLVPPLKLQRHADSEAKSRGEDNTFQYFTIFDGGVLIPQPNAAGSFSEVNLRRRSSPVLPVYIQAREVIQRFND
ncbi:MAG: hypothetical protein JW894_16705 [Bacteroidales bacterium]|nr:hypothetical protein [Bacteroidales bacterium]